MLKRTGWLIAVVVLLGLSGFVAGVDAGRALPAAQGERGATIGAYGNLVLLAKAKCNPGFCYGCEKQKVCVVWKHNDTCTDHDTSNFACCKFWVLTNTGQCSCKASYCPNGGCECRGHKSCTSRACCDTFGGLWVC